MKRLRLLFAPLGHFLSHRSRCLAVAEEMHARGHEVALVCVPGEEALIAGRGLRAYPAYAMTPSTILAFGAPAAFQRRFHANGWEDLIVHHRFGVEQMVADDLAIYEDFQPDGVVWDGRPTSPVTACLQGLVAIGLNNLSMPFEDPRGDASEERPATVQAAFQRELAQVLAPRIQASAVHARFNRHLSWIVPGLPVTENPAKLGLLGDPVHTYVGPLHWRGWDVQPGPGERAVDGRPLALVTLGSTFPFPHVALAAAQALHGDGFDVILNMEALESADDLPAGVRVCPRLNLRACLAQAELVVHHAGHGTTMEALRAGVPAVMLPFNGDQIDIARRMARLSCGVVLEGYPGDVGVRAIRAAVATLRGDSRYREQAGRFRDELARWPDGAGLAADFIARRVPQIQELLR